MTWKKLLVGTAGSALLVGWAVSLSDCTVCSGPQCFNGTDSGGTDAVSEGSAGDSGGEGGAATCSAIKPQGPLFWDDVTGTKPCDKCMTAKCCAEAKTCVAQTGMDSCTDYMSCIDACTDPDGGAIDPQCAAACAQTDPMGKPVAEAMISCLQSKCTNECK